MALRSHRNKQITIDYTGVLKLKHVIQLSGLLSLKDKTRNKKCTSPVIIQASLATNQVLGTYSVSGNLLPKKQSLSVKCHFVHWIKSRLHPKDQYGSLNVINRYKLFDTVFDIVLCTPTEVAVALVHKLAGMTSYVLCCLPFLLKFIIEIC